MKKNVLYYGWIILAMGTLAVFGVLGLARFSYAMVLPMMQNDLGMTNGQAGLLASFNLVGYLVFSILGGALSSRYGARIVAALGLLLAGTGMMFTGLAQGFAAVAIWRGLTGIGSGATNIAVMGLLPAWFSSEKRGFASGIAVSGSSIALIFSGLFVPWLITEYGQGAWRICWVAFGVVVILLAVCAYFILRNNPAEKGGKEWGYRIESQGGKGAINWHRVYLAPSVWYLGLVYSAFGFSHIIYMTFFTKFLISDGGYTPLAAGKLFMLMGWLSLMCGVLWGLVSDSIGRKNTLIILYLVHAAAYGLFALGNSSHYYILSAVLFGLTAWSIPAVMAASCGDLLGSQLAPAALGFITLFLGIGMAVSPVIGGAIADAAGTFSPAFLLAAVVALLGALASLFLSNNAQDSQVPGERLSRKSPADVS